MVRRETEKCDRLGGFLSLLSLAGGTGSGVGAYITEALRDEFPQVRGKEADGSVLQSESLYFFLALWESFVYKRTSQNGASVIVDQSQ
jgi:hypothetical protein